MRKLEQRQLFAVCGTVGSRPLQSLLVARRALTKNPTLLLTRGRLTSQFQTATIQVFHLLCTGLRRPIARPSFCGACVATPYGVGVAIRRFVAAASRRDRPGHSGVYRSACPRGAALHISVRRARHFALDAESCFLWAVVVCPRGHVDIVAIQQHERCFKRRLTSLALQGMLEHPSSPPRFDVRPKL